MLAIHEQPYLDLNGNHSNFGSVGKKKKKASNKQTKSFEEQNRGLFFFSKKQ